MALHLDLVPRDLWTGVEALLVRIGELTDENWDRSGFSHTKPTFSVELLSDKWLRVNRHDGQKSVWGFVAVVDFSNKALGQVIRGGIYKAASFKVPARHVRGSVLTPDFSQCGCYGPAYLR